MEGNLLFVGGDLSGIQKFIYNITSKKAMVSLKGRSYYLKDFTEKVCNEILAIPEIKNSKFSQYEMKIYCSGGKFYLKVPDTPTIRESIDSIKRDVEAQIWKEHRGQLAINIAYLPFQYDGVNVVIDGETDNIGLLWKKINEKFTALKNQKFKSLLFDQYNDFFKVQEVGGVIKVCQVTGIEGDVVPVKMYDDEEDLMVSPSVKAQIGLGKELRKKQGFKMLEDYAGDTYLGVLRMDVDGLGKKFASGNFKTMDEYKTYSNNLDKFFTDKLYNDLQKRTAFEPHLNIVYAGGDDVFVVGRWDKVIDFAETIREEFRFYCDKVLKDELSISGGIAIVHSKFPIAKAAQIAADAEDKAKDYIFETVQKDAFCMFGQPISWRNKLPDFLKQETLDLETIDKLLEFITPNHSSSIQEYAFVKANKILLKHFISAELLSKALLHKIMLWHSIIEDNIKKKNGDKQGKTDYSYIWHTAYYLTRYADRFKGVKDKEHEVGYDALSDIEKLKLKAMKYCNLLKDKILSCGQSDKYYQLLSLAARWTELEIKIN